MPDPKVTHDKAQEILKSMQSKYSEDGSMTIEYFETLEKDVFDDLKRWSRKIIPKKKPEQTTESPAPTPLGPPRPVVQTPSTEPTKTPAGGLPTDKPSVSTDAIHQANMAVAPRPSAEVEFLPRTHSLSKIKELVQSGAVNEKGEVEVTPEEAAFTLTPLTELFAEVKDEKSFLKMLEDATNIIKERATDPTTQVINPLYSGRVVNILKQSLVKKYPATDTIRALIIDSYKKMVPFSNEEKRADPVIEEMNREFLNVLSGKDIPENLRGKLRMKTLGNLVGQKYVQHLTQGYLNWTNVQLSKIANAHPGDPIKKKQPNGKMVAVPATELEIHDTKHELRVRRVIQEVQNFLWNNYGITTYLGSSKFGNGAEVQAKRNEDFSKLRLTAGELTAQIESAEAEKKNMLGKTGAVIIDSSEFPEEEKDDDNTYFVIKRR